MLLYVCFSSQVLVNTMIRPDNFQPHTDIRNGSPDQVFNIKTLHNLAALSIEMWLFISPVQNHNELPC